MSKRRGLRDLMKDGLVAAPGVYNALSAKMVEDAGFDAVYMTGFGTAAVNRALPDIGLMTMSEMLDVVRAITTAVEIPLIADGDTGYGNPLNVMRTIQEYEKAGAAAIHLEDQIWPKRCGHMEGKQVIPMEDMASKIRAAVDSRLNDDFVVIARTDALAVEGWSSGIERLHAYAEAGADVVFMDGQSSEEHVKDLPGLFTKPSMINLGPLTPAYSITELEKIGYSLAVFPAACLGPVILALKKALQEFKASGNAPDLGEYLEVFADFNRFLGVPRYRELEEHYRSSS
jgi:2-methylisocitrate lyase-like PEP mutase family enzyme